MSNRALTIVMMSLAFALWLSGQVVHAGGITDPESRKCWHDESIKLIPFEDVPSAVDELLTKHPKVYVCAYLITDQPWPKDLVRETVQVQFADAEDVAEEVEQMQQEDLLIIQSGVAVKYTERKPRLTTWGLTQVEGTPLPSTLESPIEVIQYVTSGLLRTNTIDAKYFVVGEPVQ